MLDSMMVKTTAVSVRRYGALGNVDRAFRWFDSLSFMITIDYEGVDITIFLIWLTGDGSGTETNVNFQIKKL